VLLIRRDSADYRAIAARCTHQGCQVRPGGEFLTCPCHGSTFDLDGAVVRGPAQRPLATFPVKVEGGRVEIDLR
jgi:Rieske Fe-S protein